MHEMIKYGLVGVVNTIIGYGIFLICYEWINFSPESANAIGYAFGLCAAFILNKKFVFKKGKISFSLVVRFLLAFIIAFFFNQITLIALITHSSIWVEIAQIFAMAIYTIMFYLLSKYFVFGQYQGRIGL